MVRENFDSATAESSSTHQGASATSIPAIGLVRPLTRRNPYESPVEKPPVRGITYGVVWRVAQYAWGD